MDISSYFRTEEEVNSRLDKIMSDAFNALWAAAGEARVTLRTAAFTLASRRRFFLVHALNRCYSRQKALTAPCCDYGVGHLSPAIR
jgi:Glutamate/Leucine/Phenylalanine/Valine dehydrogenase